MTMIDIATNMLLQLFELIPIIIILIIVFDFLGAFFFGKR